MKTLSKIESFVVLTLLVVLVVFTFANVVLRYIFDYSILGSVEFSILIFAWLIFLGSSMAISTKQHIKITLLEGMLSKKANEILSTFLSLIILCVSLYLAVSGFSLTFKVFGETLGATNLPKAAVYLAFPVGFALSSVHLIHQLFSKFRIKVGN